MKNIHPLYAKFLRNKCTRQEAEAVLRWLDTSEGKQQVEATIKQSMQEEEHRVLLLEQSESAALFTAIQQQIHEAPVGTVQHASGQAPSDTFGRTSPRLHRVAAAAALLLLASGGGYWWKQTHLLVHVANDTSHNKVVALPDGSTVVLYKNSHLKYAQNWQQDAPRTVQLQGDAYFTVTHTKSNTAFSVAADDSTMVQVLGTEFEFSARDKATRVVLERGSVNITFPKSSALAKQVLVPGDMVSYNKATKLVQRLKVNTALYASRGKSAIDLQQTSLQDITKALYDVYGYQVVFQDPAVLQQRFSGALPNDSIRSILDGIANLTGLQYRQKGEHVVFHK